MKIIEPGFIILKMPTEEECLIHLEEAARTCYKSEDKIKPGSAKNLLTRIIRTGHESVLEHASASVRIICDRGISHEIVRHRICAFSQESTRYANYSQNKFGNEITVIRPFFWKEGTDQFTRWKSSMTAAETIYLELIKNGASAQEARSVLPNSLKTELVMTANMREWRHIFKLRCAKAAHPQIRQIMLPLLAAMYGQIPLIFEDIYTQFQKEMDFWK